MNNKTKVSSMFTAVEIEVNSRCNRKCGYCPVSMSSPPTVPEFISDRLFDKILVELSQAGFSGRISYHFYNEPLLHPNLEGLINKSKVNIPMAYQVLYTNGTLLTEERYYSLKDAGIDQFRVTKHDYIPIPDRPDQIVLFPTDHIFCNRGGTLFKLEEPLCTPCFAPSEIIVITITGDVLLCCNDFNRSCVIGNVSKRSLEEIWFSEAFYQARNVLEKGNRNATFDICKHCDNQEYNKKGTALSWEGLKVMDKIS